MTNNMGTSLFIQPRIFLLLQSVQDRRVRGRGRRNTMAGREKELKERVVLIWDLLWT